MTDKRNIRHISLATLGTVGACALILLAGPQEAQAAPPEPGDEPIISTTQVTLPGSVSALFPNGDEAANHGGDFINWKVPRPPKGTWWNEKIDRIDIGTLVLEP
ncbi:hypothetical protein [Paractinoplanes tereljensis]